MTVARDHEDVWRIGDAIEPSQTVSPLTTTLSPNNVPLAPYPAHEDAQDEVEGSPKVSTDSTLPFFVMPNDAPHLVRQLRRPVAHYPTRRFGDLVHQWTRHIGFWIVVAVLCLVFISTMVFWTLWTRPKTPILPHQDALDHTVLLLSLDGFREEYFHRHLTPSLDHLARRGVRAAYMAPQFPSVTFPNHWSIATDPADHGIVSNIFQEPNGTELFWYSRPIALQRKWWGGEPIWRTLQKAAIKTGAVFWPGSEVPTLTPDRYLRYAEDADRLSSAARVNRILEWLKLPKTERPRFICAYFSLVDSAGHMYGPESSAVNYTIAEMDRAIGLLDAKLQAAELWQNVTLVVVSDHGMSGATKTRKIVLDDIFDLDRARVDERGPIATITPKYANETETIYSALQDASGRLGHFQVYYRETMPAKWHYRDNLRIAPIVAVADPGWSLIYRSDFDPKRDVELPVRGIHGHDPAATDMHAIFQMTGARVRSPAQALHAKVVSVAPPINNTDVYAGVLCALFGVPPAPNNLTAEGKSTLERYYLE